MSRDWYFRVQLDDWCALLPVSIRLGGVRSEAQGSFRPGLGKEGGLVRSCLGAPLPHTGLAGPLELAAARRVASLQSL